MREIDKCISSPSLLCCAGTIVVIFSGLSTSPCSRLLSQPSHPHPYQLMRSGRHKIWKTTFQILLCCRLRVREHTGIRNCRVKQMVPREDFKGFLDAERGSKAGEGYKGTEEESIQGSFSLKLVHDQSHALNIHKLWLTLL